MQGDMPAVRRAELQFFRTLGQIGHGIYDRNPGAVLQSAATSAGQHQHPIETRECGLIGGGQACRPCSLPGMARGLTAAARSGRDGRIIAQGLQQLQQCRAGMMFVAVGHATGKNRIPAASRRRIGACCRWSRQGPPTRWQNRISRPIESKAPVQQRFMRHQPQRGLFTPCQGRWVHYAGFDQKLLIGHIGWADGFATPAPETGVQVLENAGLTGVFG